MTLDSTEIEYPTEEDVKDSIRFTTYLNYLVNISDFLEFSYSNPASLANEVVGSKSFQSIQSGRCDDFTKIGKLLRNAWLTELHLNLTFQQDDFISYSNHWAPVQVYYSTYLTLRALFISMTASTPHDHATTLKAIGEEIKRRPDLLPSPWNVVCVGDPKIKNEILNLPSGASFNKVSSLSSYAGTWSSYAMFLKTTRARLVNEKCDGWKKGAGKMKINKVARMKLVSALSPTTLFNSLYRLRLRSNYEDADSVLVSLPGSDEAMQFNKALKTISWNTLFVLETLIARYITKKEFEAIVLSFRRYETTQISKNLIEKRWEVISGAF